LLLIKVNDVIEVTIEKLVYEGLGLARYGENNFVVFIKNSLPDEKIKARITSLNKSFARAQIEEIVIPSKNRIKPFCPLYNACGSCNMQICDYDYQIQQKTFILRDIFKDIIDEAKISLVVKSPNIEQYRHKIQYPAQQTKNSRRILMGYYKEGTHELTNIKFCPIQPSIVNEIVKNIRDNFPLDCYDEKSHKGLLKNVLMRISAQTGEILLTLVLNCLQDDFEAFNSKIFKFAKKLMSDFSEIKGCFVNFNSKKSNKILGEETLKIQGENFIIEKMANKQYKIGPVGFFQVNPLSAVNLFEIVKSEIKPNSTILDAYGGVGAIGIYVSEKASKITLVEENKDALKMAYENFKMNNIENFEIFEGDAKKHFLDFQRENKKFDYIILDPPRSGCDKEGLSAILNLAKNIIYVSCNPQTLKRDSKYLIENRFKLKSIQGVDLFPHTHHIESVAVFEKS